AGAGGGLGGGAAARRCRRWGAVVMGGAAAAPAAGRGWLAKVLAGYLLACGVLDFARSLPADEWDAFGQSVERVRARVLTADVLAVLGASADVGQGAS
ncbi:MAG TPA: hypothetical protein VGC24_03960, partial [Burkholderiaceae bacterium]